MSTGRIKLNERQKQIASKYMGETQSQTASRLGLSDAQKEIAKKYDPGIAPQTTSKPMANKQTQVNGENSQKKLTEAWTRVTNSQTKVPTAPDFGERVQKTVSGAAKGSAAAYTNVGGVVLEGLGKIGSYLQDKKDARLAAQDQAYLEKYEKDLQDAVAAGDEKAAKTAQMRINQVKYRLKTSGDLGDYYDSVNSEAVQKVYGKADELAEGSQSDITRAKQGTGKLGQLAVDLGVAGTQLAGDAGLAVLTQGTALLPMAMRSFGSSTQEARQSGASFGQQVGYGAGSAALSVATEKISNVAAPFKKMFGKGVLDQAIEKASGRLMQSAAGKTLLSSVGEGFEEIVEDALQPILQRITYDKEAMEQYKDPDYLANTLYDGLIGAALGGIGGGIEQAGTRVRGSVKGQTETGTGSKKTASGMDAADALKADTTLFNRDILQNFNGARTYLIDYAKKHFPSSVVNAETGKTIGISRNGLDKFLSGNIYYEKYASGFHIPELIERAVKTGEAANYHGDVNGIPGYEYYDSPIRIDGKECMAHIRVRNTTVGDKYYGHTVSEVENIEIEPSTRASDPVQPAVQSVKIDSSTSVDSIPQVGRKVKNMRSTDDIMPKLDGGKFSMGRSFNELVQNQRDGVEPGSGGQYAMRGFETEGPELRMPKLEDPAEKRVTQTAVREGGSETDGYLDALAQDENELVDPVTPADIVYDAKLRGLQQEEAPPENRREPVAKRDLDELVQLYQDAASPVETDRSARFQESEGLVRSRTEEEHKSVRDRAREAKSYFMRKMVDAGDSVTKMGNAVKDSYLYPFYNMARSSASAGVNMIQNEQTDITGKKVGESLNDIFNPIREQGDAYYEQFEIYMFDLHNMDRMRLVTGENTAKLEAEMALREFDRENPDVATLTEARLQRKANSIDPEEAALGKERIRLLRRLNQADRMGNKPVFGYEVTADMSKERSDRLLREHPEFEQYREQVRTYIRNLMQYRVDSGLMTAEDAAFLEKYYPNYVPTFRATEKPQKGKNQKSVQVGKTVGLAEGGSQKLVPLHEALGKQTMQVVREGGKNRFGARLLEDFRSNSQNEKVRRYILDAQEYESDFSTETFDQPDVELKKSNTFAVYKDGKKYEMTLDPSMFDAVKALYPDAQESNDIIKAIRAGNNLFKALVTGYNPTFTIRNTVRDLQTAGLYSRDAAAFAKNYPLALKEIARNGDYWKQYKALGGSFSSVFDYQTGTVSDPDGKVAKLAAKMEAVNMAMEQAPRLAEFMSVVKAGDGSMENLMDAMYAAADVTVNFGRAGTLGKVLNANFVPFLNPGIQGFDKMVRRVTETKGGKEWAKLVVRAAVLGVAPTVINGLLYSDDEDWEDLKDSDKDTNYIFKIGDGVWLKVPKGRELSILGMTADRIQDVVKGEDVNWSDFITTAGNQVAPANPLRQNILAAWFDTDLFDDSNPGRTWYGGDIESQRLQNYAPGERYDSSTDVFSKWLGKQLNLSPKKINYLLDQYSGVVGDFLLPLLTPQAERNPFSKAFTVDSVSSNRISGDFYDKSDELTYARSGGDSVAAVTSRFWSKQQTACSDIYKEIREIESSDLSDAEKKEKVREARAVLNGIQKNALSVLDTYQAAVEKYLHGTSDEAVDYAYREANRECFGAEYALETYSKDTYAKAQEAKRNGVSYEDFYTYYFDTKDMVSSGGKSVTTQNMEYLQKSGLSEKSKAEIYFADLASDSDLKKQAELESSSNISAEQYWQYKMAVSGLSKKAEKLEAINSLNLTADQKTALYFANGWAASTLDEAPWMDIWPKIG